LGCCNRGAFAAESPLSEGLTPPVEDFGSDRAACNVTDDKQEITPANEQAFLNDGTSQLRCDLKLISC
jgi:hypothetical protein